MKKLSILLVLSLPFFASAQTSEDATEKKSKPNEEILTFSETMPEFPGGIEALYQYLAKEVKYPENLKKNRIEARVIAKFVINTEGEVKDIQIVNVVAPEFAEETIRILGKMPKWSPGLQMGKPVNVVFTLPLAFKLK